MTKEEIGNRMEKVKHAVEAELARTDTLECKFLGFVIGRAKDIDYGADYAIFVEFTPALMFEKFAIGKDICLFFELGMIETFDAQGQTIARLERDEIVKILYEIIKDKK